VGLYLAVEAYGSDFGKMKALKTWMRKRLPSGSRRYSDAPSGETLEVGVVEGPFRPRDRGPVHVTFALPMGDWGEVQDGLGKYRPFILGLVNFVDFIDSTKRGPS
jgi:hypothetical protein